MEDNNWVLWVDVSSQIPGVFSGFHASFPGK